jgi:Family of unknown function (DUF6188)
MELIEENYGWRISFCDGTVQLIKIDFRLGLLLIDGAHTADLYFETPFHLICSGIDSCCVPDKPESLAASLSLVNKKVNEVRIENSGHMVVDFEAGTSIKVDPHPSYEAWQIGGSTGFLLVCRPEEGVSFFKEGPPN